MGNIPQHVRKVKEAMVDNLKEYPVKALEYGLQISASIADEALVSMLIGILEVEKSSVCVCRLRLGDAWNQMTQTRGVRKRVIDELSRRLGKNYYELFKTWGWVASKWPEKDREFGVTCGWSYMVANKPGLPAKTKADLAPVVIYEEEVTVDEGKIVRRCSGGDGRKYIVLLRDDEDTGEHVKYGAPILFRGEDHTVEARPDFFDADEVPA